MWGRRLLEVPCGVVRSGLGILLQGARMGSLLCIVWNDLGVALVGMGLGDTIILHLDDGYFILYIRNIVLDI